MSLHISNLSSRVRINEIERVFRRFGHCNVNLKNGYGFVVYNVPTHAEKALKVLRGTYICGESITISWSKQQPRSLDKLSRSNRLYELQRGRNSRARVENSNMKLIYKGRRDRKNEFKHQATNGGTTSHENKTDSMTRYNEDNNKVTAVEDRGNPKEDYPNEGDNVQKKSMDIDRWEQGVGVLSSEFDGEQECIGDDPYLDFADMKDVDENLPERYSGRSPSVVRPQSKIGSEVGEGAKNNLDKSNSQQSFYTHGESGHKMMSGSGEKGSQEKKLRRSDYKKEIDFQRNIEGIRSRSQEKLQFSRDVQMRHPQIDRKLSSPRKNHMLLKRVDSRIQVETQRRDCKKDFVERKHSGEDNLTPERQVKKVRGLVSSSVCFAHTASRSHSKSKSSRSASRSDSVSRSRSKSLSSQTYSPSTKPEQKYSGSGSKEARSRSSSPASSHSVSLGRALPSLPNESSNNTLMNQDDNLKDATCPDAIDALLDQEQPVEVDAGSHSLKHENMQMENSSAVELLKDVNDAQEDHIPQDENNDSSMANSSELRDDQYPDVPKTVKTFSPSEGIDSEALMLGTSSRSCLTNPARISSEELCIVLKHYGLDVPAEDEKNLPVEAYFGSARLWPWQVIYYRRLKKGSISIENYARRIAQNQEFGIVDKYIRSSSGWGELGEEDF